MAISPDGKMIASVGEDHRIRLWDAATGMQLRTLPGHPEWVRKIAISPDGKLLVSAGNDGTVRLWNVATGRQIGQPIRHFSNYLNFGPDGKTLALSAELARQRRPVILSAEECENLWIDLGSKHSDELCRRALRRLAAAPQSTVAFLKQRFQPDVPRDERLKRLLADLDSDTFAVRENASRELAGMGKRIEPALRSALGEKLSPEQRRRVQELLNAIAPPPPRFSPRQFRELTVEQQRLVRAAVVLDRIGTGEALDLLHYLVHTTPLKAILNDRQVRGEDMREAKEALKRLAERSDKP